MSKLRSSRISQTSIYPRGGGQTKTEGWRGSSQDRHRKRRPPALSARWGSDQHGGYRHDDELLVLDVPDELVIEPPEDTLVVAGRITCQIPPNVLSPSPVAARRW
jgi:hypothetical protein